MSCAAHPPPKGWKCLDCWQCLWPPNSTHGTCKEAQLVGPANTISTCEAGGTKAKPLFSTQKACLENCGKPPGVTCYKCDIQPGEQKGSCVTIHPSQGGKPLNKCPDWTNVFPTLNDCRDKCTQSGPIKPVAKCWQSTGPDCECVLGDAEGPHGPLDSCESSMGFYNTRTACVKACEDKSGGGDKTIWIIVGVSVSVLILLVIIAVVIYFLWKKHKGQY